MPIRSSVYVLLIILLASMQKVFAQDTTLSRVNSFQDQFYSSLDRKTASIERKLKKQTEKYLSKLQEQEAGIKRKLLQKDSTLAAQLFQEGAVNYTSLRSAPESVGKYSFVYSGHLDSLSTALNFLKCSHAVAITNDEQVDKTLKHLQGLQGRLNQTDQVQKYLGERQQLLTEQLQKLGMAKQLRRFNSAGVLLRSSG